MYESFYKLRAKPFRLSPDSGFFYPSRGHKRALAYLRYGLSQGEGFVVITGDPGTGKTTLAQILLKEMNQQHLVVAHLTTTQLEADEMLRMVSASFGLRYEGMDKAALLKTLEAFLLARARERKRALLVVDEAQNLPARSLEELRMLSNLQVGDRALLQTFLLGQPQFRQKLEHPDLEQLRQRVIANYHLSALAPDECRSYVESRLRQVGWQDDPSFTEQAFKAIYEYSEGIPRRINMLCDRVLLFSFLEEKHEVNHSILHQVTDELGQEISGRPPSVEKPAESLLHDDSFDVGRDVEESAARAATQKVVPQKGTQEAVTDAAAESFETEAEVLRPDELHDSSEKLAAALREKARHAAEEPSKPAKTVREVTNTEADPAADVFELASAEKSLMEPETDHVATDGGKASVPEDSALDRAVPDDGWARPVPQVDLDESESGSTEIAAEAGSLESPRDEETKSAQQDRFRVIPGGRGTETDRRQPVVLAPLPDAPGDTDEVTTRKILRLVLAFHRSPRSFPGLDDSSQPLPRGVRNILQLAVSDDEVLRDLRQISVMGISPAMLRAAVRFFVRRVMFVPGSDDYRVLGLQQGASLTEIEVNYGLLMRLLRHDNTDLVDSGVSRIGSAYEHLCRGEQRPATSNENPVLSDIEAIDNIGDLDLDVAPKVPDAVNISMPQAATMQRDAFVEIDDGHSGVHIRHVILVSCLVVVLLVLYVTQIRDQDSKTPVSTAPAEPAHQVVPEGQLSAVAPGLGRVDEGNLRDFSQNQATDEDMPVALPEATSAGAASDAWQGAVSPVVRGNELGDEQFATSASGVQAEEEARAQAAAEAVRREEIARQEEVARQAAITRKKAEEEAKAAAEARAVAEARARARAEEEARIQAMNEAKARTKAEADARAAAAAERVASERNTVLQSMSEARSNVAAKTPQVAVASGISEPNLVQLMGQFLAYYENGDLNGVMSLFYSKARTDTQTTGEGIRTEYEKTFTTTDKRNMVFSDLSWKWDDTFARGRGKFQATILSAGAGVPVLTSGKVTLQVTKGAAGLQISRLYFSDMKTIEGSQPTASNPPLSEADLDPLMSALVAYYEAGDINAFMDLFSSDASSDDRSTATGIRKDYQGLFDSTVARRMELQNLHWILEDGFARGESDYVVEVQTDKHGAVDVYRGTLWVRVEPRKGLARIVHFAFAE
ncbi:MAG: XrtA-associated ATPase [Gammaproteobacteria bacterium]|nr:XrtA-associated ATPase [Gammaproteobacteria bacterium]